MNEITPWHRTIIDLSAISKTPPRDAKRPWQLYFLDIVNSYLWSIFFIGSMLPWAVLIHVSIYDSPSNGEVAGKNKPLVIAALPLIVTVVLVPLWMAIHSRMMAKYANELRQGLASALFDLEERIWQNMRDLTINEHTSLLNTYNTVLNSDEDIIDTHIPDILKIIERLNAISPDETWSEES